MLLLLVGTHQVDLDEVGWLAGTLGLLNHFVEPKVPVNLNMSRIIVYE